MMTKIVSKNHHFFIDKISIFYMLYYIFFSKYLQVFYDKNFAFFDKFFGPLGLGPFGSFCRIKFVCLCDIIHEKNNNFFLSYLEFYKYLWYYVDIRFLGYFLFQNCLCYIHFVYLKNIFIYLNILIRIITFYLIIYFVIFYQNFNSLYLLLAIIHFIHFYFILKFILFCFILDFPYS